MDYINVKHEFEPVYNKESKILILGSFPSVKSRQQSFYYAHPQNRFWKILARLYNEELPSTIEAKKELLLHHHIAIWDVIESCQIKGSSDASIKEVVPIDINRVMKQTQITHIYTNGKTAAKLYHQYLFPVTQIKAVTLPSSSPANATFSLERLIEEWQVIREN